jgi:hypothetical protein
MRSETFEFKRWARWLGTFVGFPLAGVAARVAAGNIDSVGAAVIGGLAGGATLGVIQVAVGGIVPEDRIRWIAATAAGFAAGLTVGADSVGYRTNTASLVAMGAFAGGAVGLAQALSIPMRVVDRVLWTVATPALWAGAWFITSHVIVDADRQHALFGAPSGLAVCALSGVLYAIRGRRTASMAALVGNTSDRAAA